MKKILIFIVPLCVAIFASCTQQKGPSEEEIQRRIDAAVKAALAEKPSNTSSSEPSTYNENSSASSTTEYSSSEKKRSSSPVGKYIFSDDYNDYTLIINSDETCQIESNGRTYYGSWDEWCHKSYWIRTSESLWLIVNGKKDLWSPMIDLSLQWMYRDSTPLEAKDPTNRVKLTRIE